MFITVKGGAGVLFGRGAKVQTFRIERMNRMKLKKWLAVALSAVMAAGVLAGCGGGGTGGSLSLSKVNGLLLDAGSSVTVTPDEALDSAVRSAVSDMKEEGAFSTLDAMASVNKTLELPSISLTGVKAGGAYVITEDELESGINAAALATFFEVNIDTSKLGDLAVVDSADEFAAAAVLAADTLVHQYLTEGNIRQYVQSEELAAQLVALLENGVDFTYHVSAQRTSYNGVTYWVFGAQAAATPSLPELPEQN